MTEVISFLGGLWVGIAIIFFGGGYLFGFLVDFLDRRRR